MNVLGGLVGGGIGLFLFATFIQGEKHPFLFTVSFFFIVFPVLVGLGILAFTSITAFCKALLLLAFLAFLKPLGR